MKNRMMLGVVKGVALAALLVTFAGCMTLVSDNPLGLGKSWKEEVLLHDGSKIVVKRSQDYDPMGRREIGQGPPRSEETLRFIMPGSKKVVTWESDFGRELQDNLTLLALDIFNGIPYIVTHATRCHAYNKWGRPNPPYVCFKYDGETWQRIPLEALPQEMKEGNVIFGGYDERWDRDRLWSPEPVSAAEIRRINASGVPQYLRVFTRKPLDPKKFDCGEMIYDGNGGWIGVGWFRDQPSYDACVEVCKRHKMSPQYCPCDDLFNKSNKEK